MKGKLEYYHKLMILTGRYDKTTITNRLCPSYSSDEIENNIPYSLTVLQTQFLWTGYTGK